MGYDYRVWGTVNGYRVRLPGMGYGYRVWVTITGYGYRV